MTEKVSDKLIPSWRANTTPPCFSPPKVAPGTRFADAVSTVPACSAPRCSSLAAQSPSSAPSRSRKDRAMKTTDELTLNAVREYYGRVLKSTADLQTSACCTIERLPPHLAE